MRPPRILLACDWLLKYAAGLAQGLREAGADVALLTRDHGLEYGGNAGEKGEGPRTPPPAGGRLPPVARLGPRPRSLGAPPARAHPLRDPCVRRGPDALPAGDHDR